MVPVIVGSSWSTPQIANNLFVESNNQSWVCFLRSLPIMKVIILCWEMNTVKLSLLILLLLSCSQLFHSQPVVYIVVVLRILVINYWRSRPLLSYFWHHALSETWWNSFLKFFSLIELNNLVGLLYVTSIGCNILFVDDLHVVFPALELMDGEETDILKLYTLVLWGWTSLTSPWEWLLQEW